MQLTKFDMLPMVSQKQTLHHNLPQPLTDYIEHNDIQHIIKEILQQPESRLVTITGQGGVGKTRLSIELGWQLLAHFTDGVYFIPLETLENADDIPAHIAHYLELNLSKPDIQSLITRIQDARLLFILDNCEHLPESVQIIQQLIKQLPQLKLLVTSRQSLNLHVEYVQHLTGMPLPSANDDQTNPAIQLFLNRAKRVNITFNFETYQEAIIDICQATAGLPLALEIAANWTKTLHPSDIAIGIRRNIGFLKTTQHDVPERHRSIRAVFDYSWAMLSPEQQKVLRRLAVFSGGFSRVAAEQIGGTDLSMLASLIDHSFLEQVSHQRYHLHRLLRRYILEHLHQVSQPSQRSYTTLLTTTVLKGDFEYAKSLIDEAQSGDYIHNPALMLAMQGLMFAICGKRQMAESMCHASLDTTSAIPFAHVFARVGLAIVACEQTNTQLAIQHGCGALHQFSRLRSHGLMVLCLLPIAVSYALNDELDYALELIALAYSREDTTLDGIDQWQLLADTHEKLYSELDKETYNACWQRGIERSLSDTVDELLNQNTVALTELKKVKVQAANQHLLEPLTKRELEILQLIAQDLTNREIAHRLSIEINTVKKHITNLYGKLSVSSRLQAVLQAKKYNLLIETI